MEELETEVVKKEISVESYIKALVKKNKEFAGTMGWGNYIPFREGISTGSIALDLKMGGWLPRDRIIEYYGPEASCKTSAGLIAIKSYVDKFGYDRPPFIIDLEYSITENFVKGFGIDPSRLFICQPHTAEEALDILLDLVSSRKFGIGLFDSVDALVGKKEWDRSFADQSMGEAAKLMSRAMRQLSKLTITSDCGTIFINQIRANLSPYAPPETTSAGAALKFYASMRVRWSKKPSTENKTALTISPRIIKNKMYPLIVAESAFDLIPGQGILWFKDFLEASKQLGVIEQAGRSYRLKDDQEVEVMRWGSAEEVEKWMIGNNYKDKWAKLIEKKFNIVKGGMIIEGEEVEEDAINS